MAFRKRFMRGRKTRGRGRKGRGRKTFRKQRHTRIRATKTNQKIMPDAEFVKLNKTYHGTLSFSASDASAYQIVSLGLNHFGSNTAGTIAPVNYHNYANQFESCCILGSSIRVKFLNDTLMQGNTNNFVGVYPTREFSGVTTDPVPTKEELLTQPRCKWTSIGSSSGMGKAGVKHYMAVKQLVGHKIDQESDFEQTHYYDSTTGLFTVWIQPTELTYWQLFAASIKDSGSQTSSVDYIADVDYYCKFQERVNTQVSYVSPGYP